MGIVFIAIATVPLGVAAVAIYLAFDHPGDDF